jgi:hypothetical protein
MPVRWSQFNAHIFPKTKYLYSNTAFDVGYMTNYNLWVYLMIKLDL